MTLGVEEITYDEVLGKLGVDALPNIDFSSTDTTRWTSRRLVTTYYGQHYELQILEGVPIDIDSPLVRRDLVVEYNAPGGIAGAVEAIKVLGLSGAGSIPVIGPILSIGITFYDMYSAVKDNLATTTVIRDIEGTAKVYLTSHMRYILVKPYQTPDVGNQATCYIGSTVSYRVRTSTDFWYLNDSGELEIEAFDYESVEETASSSYYDDFSVPAKNYHNYLYNGITEYTYDYSWYEITIRIFGVETDFRAPYEMPHLA